MLQGGGQNHVCVIQKTRCGKGLRVVHWGKMTKISKHGRKLKLLPFSTELLFSFEIFSDHLFLMAKSKTTYMCQLTKIMTSSASFK